MIVHHVLPTPLDENRENRMVKEIDAKKIDQYLRCSATAHIHEESERDIPLYEKTKVQVYTLCFFQTISQESYGEIHPSLAPTKTLKEITEKSFSKD